MEKIEPQLRAFVMNPCLYYSTLSVIYALDAVSSFPGIMMGIVMISQIVADAANFMDMRESDAYTNQSRRCSASFNFIGNLLAVAFSSARLLGVFVSLFGHFHILGFLGRFLPLVFFILSIYRVRIVVQENQRDRDFSLGKGFVPSWYPTAQAPAQHIDLRADPKITNFRTTYIQTTADPHIDSHIPYTIPLQNPSDGPRFPHAFKPSPTDRCAACNDRLVSVDNLAMRMPGCGHWYHCDCLTRAVCPAGQCPACLVIIAKLPHFKP